MVNVIKDHTEHRYGYQIMESSDGVQRMLDEGSGFYDPGEVLRFVSRLGSALKLNKMAVLRDREATGTYGFQIYEEAINQPPIILAEHFGWFTDDEVKIHLRSLLNSINEGIRTYL
jgi:hypothetical protein